PLQEHLQVRSSVADGLNVRGVALHLGTHCTCNFCNLSVPQCGTFEIPVGLLHACRNHSFVISLTLEACQGFYSHVDVQPLVQVRVGRSSETSSKQTSTNLLAAQN